MLQTILQWSQFKKKKFFINEEGIVLEILMTVRKGIQILLQKLTKFSCRFWCA